MTQTVQWAHSNECPKVHEFDDITLYKLSSEGLERKHAIGHRMVRCSITGNQATLPNLIDTNYSNHQANIAIQDILMLFPQVNHRCILDG
jgi:hypothetical protein